MSFPGIGQTVYLHVKGDAARRGYGRVLDVRVGGFYLDEPAAESGPGPFRVQPGDPVVVSYRAADNTHHYFESIVLEHTTLDGLPTLVIDRPRDSGVKRLQQRAFVRVEVHVDVIYQCVRDGELRQVIDGTGTSRDVSGGGLSFYVPQQVDLHVGDSVAIRFSLPSDARAAPPIQARGTITRRMELLDRRSGGPFEHVLLSARFTEIAEAMRQRIIQYAFKRQIEMRGRGLR